MGTSGNTTDTAREGRTAERRPNGSSHGMNGKRRETRIGATLAKLVRWRRRPAPVKVYVDSIRI